MKQTGCSPACLKEHSHASIKQNRQIQFRICRLFRLDDLLMTSAASAASGLLLLILFRLFRISFFQQFLHGLLLVQSGMRLCGLGTCGLCVILCG